MDVTDEGSIAAGLAGLPAGELRLVVNAVGFLHGGGMRPEKSLRQLDAAQLARSFAVNAIGPALLLKHVLPRLPRVGRSVVASLSARVGSIGDNRLGGWYRYRASKAALNQFVHTAAIELGRTHREAICVALHPGTVATGLSAPFAGGAEAVTPEVAAAHLLGVMARLRAEDSGGFFDWRGDGGRVVRDGAADATEGRVADEGLRGVRAGVRLAEEVGAGLGERALLLGALPGGAEGEGHGMSALRLVMGDQLSDGISALEGLDPGRDVVLMVEVAEECSVVPHHKQKLVLFLSAMRHFAARLEARGARVDYVRLDDAGNTAGSAGRSSGRSGGIGRRGWW
jgi:NAD(P)-dependent dehydrogenase (short-subunit alcohol dehydrogenase family)